MLDKLKKITTRTKKRVGRGHSSGKGKTSARGYKGQRAREKVKIGFEGGQLPLIKRLPFKRGVGNLGKVKKATLTLRDLEKIESKTVTLEVLIKEGMISKKDSQGGVKVVSTGEITRSLIVKLPTTANAKEKIEKAGGKVEA